MGVVWGSGGRIRMRVRVREKEREREIDVYCALLILVFDDGRI